MYGAMASTSFKRKEPPPPNNNEASETGNTVRLLLHTVDGAIPYLTPHLLEKCFPIQKVKDHLWLGIAVRDVCITPIAADGEKKHPNGYTFSPSVSLDAWISSYKRVTVPTFDPHQDAIHFSPKKVADDTTLSSSKQHIMVWTDNGRQKLTNDVYLNAAQGLKSHAHVSLFDVCTNFKEKRRLAATQRTNEWRQETLQRQNSTGEVWASCLLVSSQIQDPAMEQQYTSIQEALTQESCQGVAFVGPSTDDKEHLEAAIQRLELKPNTTLAVLSHGSMLHLLNTFEQGVHILGINLPAQWAKAKKACICDWSGWQQQPQKRPKLEQDNGCLDCDGCYQIDKKWIRDVRPILPGCACMTCQNHSRAYLYHLVLTKELLVEILLFIHNLHHLLELCRELSKARQEGKQKHIVEHIKKQVQ